MTVKGDAAGLLGQQCRVVYGFFHTVLDAAMRMLLCGSGLELELWDAIRPKNNTSQNQSNLLMWKGD
jgi:hypothetical protein